jgi:hypothetical protein
MTEQENADALREAAIRRQQDRANTLKQAKRMFNPFAIPSLGPTEFPAVTLGRRESKCARAFAVVASCR